MANFKDRLKELRKEKGLTQQQLADLVYETESKNGRYEFKETFPRTGIAVMRYEKGQREPNYRTLIGLAKFFDVTIDYLLGLSEIRKLDLSTVYFRNSTF